MPKRFMLALVGLALSAGVGRANVYRVKHAGSSGLNSLRWAINRANNHAGRDNIVFAPQMAGKAIVPTSTLPSITDHRTIINGDIDGDGDPDVTISGAKTTASNLTILGARHCKIRGLSLIRAQDYGILLNGARYCKVEACHIGINLAGNKARTNGHAIAGNGGDIGMIYSHYNTIGGTSTRQGNRLAGGDKDTSTTGIYMSEASNNMVYGNTFGLAGDGLTRLSEGYMGVTLTNEVNPCVANRIGGPGGGNVFGGLYHGMHLVGAHDTIVQSNYFGLGTDGNTTAAIDRACVDVYGGSTYNIIGGSTAGERNVFGTASTGVALSSGANNVVQGNYFGLNATGTGLRRMYTHISVDGGAGAQLIGGPTPGHGNWFGGKMPAGYVSWCVYVSYAGSGSVVQNNRINVRPDGKPPDKKSYAISIHDVTVTIRDNIFRNCNVGVSAYEANGRARVYGNDFGNCYQAVRATDQARLRLGDLGNAATADDGGNLFRANCPTAIHNETPNFVKAEGNDFRTTQRSLIKARIYDKLDVPALGCVDFVPLIGGVTPTGGDDPVTISAATALPTAMGAEIAFGLSADAAVTVYVLNIAGRPIATVLNDVPAQAGLQRVVWGGRADSGLLAPAGRYIARIEARGAGGSSARAIATLSLRR